MVTKKQWLYIATIIIVPGGLVAVLGHFLYSKLRKQQSFE